jgi:hypothetical protein
MRQEAFMMNKKEQLAEELHKYENQWVAIWEEEYRIVGSGDNAYEAKMNAEVAGYPEIILFRVPLSFPV